MEENLIIQKPLVSVVILTFNGEKSIKDTINSVLVQNYEDQEIIVVDNASADNTVKILRENYSDKIQIIENKKNIGFAGHNIGIDASKGEFILCINQDVILESDFIFEAEKLFQQDKKIGAIQPKMMNKNNKAIIDSTGIKIFKSRRMVDRGQGEEDKGQYEKKEEVFGCNGAVAFFRRKCLENVALPVFGSRTSEASEVRLPKKEYYDPDFFLYKEDVDLSWRIRLYGWKIMYCPTAVVHTDRTSKPINQKDGVALMIKTRREQKQYVRHYSFKNHRLALIKNDLPWLFFKHLPWILPREIGAWLYILIFESKTWPAIGELFKQMPEAWRKRKIIMAKKRVRAGEMEKWFI